MIGSCLEDLQLTATPNSFELMEPDTVRDSVTMQGIEVSRYTKEFWTSGQRQGHSLHEISYRACFKPELPRFFIRRLSKEGGLVYDPFMGRGTTLLEAALNGRNIAGNDVNPLSRILVQPRLDPPEAGEVAERLASIAWTDDETADIDLSMFYSPKTESQVVFLRKYLAGRKAAGTEDKIDKWIRMVATSRLTGHSPGFFSVYSFPPNQAVSAGSQRKINQQRGQVPPDRDVAAIIVKKTRSLLRRLTQAESARLAGIAATARYYCCEARDRTGLEDGAVDLVVTSPPFLDVVQYAKDNWMRCWFNEIDAEAIQKKMTIVRTIEAWSAAMEDAFVELHRVVRSGGWVAFEVGEVRKGSIMLDESIVPVGIRAGFECQGIVVNQQTFSKTANCWGIKNNHGGTNTNRIVLFRKV